MDQGEGLGNRLRHKQPLLPQVLIGNEHTFKAREMEALQSARPPNVYLLRQKTAWDTKESMKRVLRLLGDALGPHLHRVQPVLLLDACRVHYAADVLAQCASRQLWPVVVPAKTTWCLQPLDTHAFKLYKDCLGGNYQNARINAGSGDLDLAKFLPCVYETIRHVLQGREWARAFEENGFGQGQRQVSDFIKGKIELPCLDR